MNGESTVLVLCPACERAPTGESTTRRWSPSFEYDGLKFDEGFRAGLLVEELVVVEPKSVEKNHPVHPKQLRTHLVLAKLPLGLVLDFGFERMKDGITRIVNGLPEDPVPPQEFGL